MILMNVDIGVLSHCVVLEMFDIKLAFGQVLYLKHTLQNRQQHLDAYDASTNSVICTCRCQSQSL